jgi:hypothetical protein
VFETTQPVNTAETRGVDKVVFDQTLVGVFTLFCGGREAVPWCVKKGRVFEFKVELIEVLRATLKIKQKHKLY